MSLDGGAKKAAKIAQQTANTNNAFDQSIYDQNKALATPYINNGTAASNAQSALLGLGGDSAAQDAAFQNYTKSDGYQFGLQQGLNGVSASAFAQGGGLSGATLKGLNNYAQNAAQTEEGNYFNQLGSLANNGLNAVSTVTKAGGDLSTDVNSNNNTASTASQNAALASAKGLNSLIGTGIGLASSFASGGMTAGGGFSGSAGLKSLLGGL